MGEFRIPFVSLVLFSTNLNVNIEFVCVREQCFIDVWEVRGHLPLQRVADDPLSPGGCVTSDGAHFYMAM